MVIGKPGSGLCDLAIALLRLALRNHSVNEQSHMYPDVHCGIKTAKPWDPPNCPPIGERCTSTWKYRTERKKDKESVGGASMRTYTKECSMRIIKWKKKDAEQV